MRRVLLSICLVALAGCSPRLNYDKSFTVDPGGEANLFVTLDPAKAEQKINVAATASGAPIDIYVFLNKHKTTIEADVFAKKTEKLLAHSEKTESATLTATIPAREEAVVWIKPSTAKKASGTLKITN